MVLKTSDNPEAMGNKSSTQTKSKSFLKRKNKTGEDSSDHKAPQKEEETQKMKCPHRTGKGYATEYGRMQWLKQHNITGSEAEKISTSLVPDADPSAELYYWQLFAILGQKKIEKIVRNFYERVYADKEAPWFVHAFTKISGIEHHIQTQTQFWCDVFGGGRYYHGGDFRLNFHHSYNAREVMTTEGAERWMYHMNKAVESTDLGKDPRIKPCIYDFLKTMMDAYAETFQFKSEHLTYGKQK